MLIVVDCDNACALAHCDSIVPDSPVESVIHIAVNKVVIIDVNFGVNNANKSRTFKKIMKRPSSEPRLKRNIEYYAIML